MAELDALVLESRSGYLRLQPLGSTCRDCSSGCGGRCNLFAKDELVELRLAPSDYAAFPGTQVRLCIDDSALRLAAWQGYGRALAGLVLGAALGHGAGLALGHGENLLAMIGLLAGTFAAMFFSKGSVPVPRVLAKETPSTPSTECIP